MKFRVESGGSLQGAIRVPGDKSMSHRTVMLGALAEGTTIATGFLEGHDALCTVQAFKDMGVTVRGPQNGRIEIDGVGMQGLQRPDSVLDMGNSGTSIRLLSGLLAAQRFGSQEGRPPLVIKGGQPLNGIHYEMPVASAQVKSCVLLAGLFAEGRTSVTEPAPTRDHTERMLRGFGYDVERENDVISVQGGGRLTAATFDIPADISSAAFFLVAASIAPNSDLTLEHVGMNPTRSGVITILTLMGADIEVLNEREVGGEPVADLRVKSSALVGIEIPEDLVPLAIDEFPVLFVAAACATGRTVLRGAEELRVKESDRIASMADGLSRLGVENEVLDDGIVIVGGPLKGGEVDTYNDHRIAMSFAVAALRASGTICINDCDHVATSFPGFAELAASVGLKVSVES
jgi:3-phosphoshikimate 1-carboxyvinyltransferase